MDKNSSGTPVYGQTVKSVKSALNSIADNLGENDRIMLVSYKGSTKLADYIPANKKIWHYKA